jgi:hypothetical protein
MLQEVLADWDSNVLSTNFTTFSGSVIDKTKQFVEVDTLKGVRVYLKPCLARILPPKGVLFAQLKPFWFLIDFLFSICNPLPLFRRLIKINDISLEYSHSADEEVVRMFQEYTRMSPLQRTGNELKWILDFPWLVSSPLGDRVGGKFFFSSSPKRFDQLITKVFRKGILLGIIMTNFTDGYLTTPYIICAEGDESVFARVILKQAISMQCVRVTTFHEAVGDAIRAVKPIGLFSIGQKRKVFCTKSLFEKMGKVPNFIEGDGDCAFV